VVWLSTRLHPLLSFLTSPASLLSCCHRCAISAAYCLHTGIARPPAEPPPALDQVGLPTLPQNASEAIGGLEPRPSTGAVGPRSTRTQRPGIDRSAETAEQRKRRLAEERANARLNESHDARAARLAHNNELARQRKVGETHEQRAARLARNNERARLQRARAREARSAAAMHPGTGPASCLTSLHLQL
jgi:hypothetical protein